MDSFKTVKLRINDIYKQLSTENTTIIIEGESGIGKSFLVDQIIQEKELFVVKIIGRPFNHSPYAVLNQSLLDLISNKVLTKELFLKSIQELAYVIPKFGLFLEQINHTTLRMGILKKSGMPLDRPNIPSLIKLIEKMSGNKIVCLYCDNVQWLDKESFESILDMTLTSKNQKWFNLLLYTNNVETVPYSHEKIKSKFSYIIKQSNSFCFSLNRWARKDIDIICSSILNGKCNFTTDQYAVLYQYTQGLTLYIKTVLDVLKQKEIIECANSIWCSKKDWNVDTILDVLKNSIFEKIKIVYSRIPDSKPILEIASVLGEIFSEKQINTIFESKNNFSILNEVEKQFQLIQHIMQDDFWKFDHYLIQDCIYHSIGQVKDLHRKIANSLEKKGNRDYGQIALHYKLGGDMFKFNEFKIKEIKQVLEIGCYSVASNIVEELEKDYLFPRMLCKEEEKDFLFLKGRCLFHLKHYEKSIDVFTQILDEDDEIDEKNAMYLKWLGKAYLKLSTQQAFKEGTIYLNKAQKFYEMRERNSELGYIYMDLVVAYAHINQLEEAREAYEKAENYFNAARDQVGILRLQRRNVIFMENKVSAIIIEQSAKMFENLELLHEMLMSLNNAATQYLFLQDYTKVSELLNKCIGVASQRGGFGLAYIYNNFGVLNCFLKDYENAERYFELAGKEHTREVEKLIIRINESTLLARNSRKKAVPLLLEIYDKACKIGEDEYIIPAAINLSKQYIKIGDYEIAQKLLLTVEKKILKLKSYYKTYIWYTLLKKCRTKNDKSFDCHEFDKMYLDKIKYDNTLQPAIYNDYILLTMQFWSEN